MALKSAQDTQEKSEVIEEALEELDKTLDRLKTLYEQYFMGIQKQAPSFIHSEVERKLRDLTQLQIRNTALRYRFNTLQQKFGSYNSYWRRTLRSMENGTYARQLQKVGRKLAQNGDAVPQEILAAMPKRMRDQVMRDRDLALAQAKRQGRVGDFEKEEGTDEDIVLSGSALPSGAVAAVDDDEPAIIQDQGRGRINRSLSGSIMLDEDQEFDLDTFLAQAAAEEEAASRPAPAPAPKPVDPRATMTGLRHTPPPGSIPRPAAAGSQPSMPPRSPTGGYPITPSPVHAAPGQPASLQQRPQPATSSATGIPRPQPATSSQSGIPQPIGPSPTGPVKPASSSQSGLGGASSSQSGLGGPPRAATQPGATNPASSSQSGIGQRPQPATSSQSGIPKPPPRMIPSDTVVTPNQPRMIRSDTVPNAPPTPRPTPPPLPPRTAASQVSRPNPIRPGSSEQRTVNAPPTVGGRSQEIQRERDTAVGPAPTPERPNVTPRPQPTQPLRPPPGMSDADVNNLYNKYVKAKEMVGEQTNAQTREKLLRTINAQAPKIMEQYNAKGVDFSIVVKDNQVIIKAKPKP